MIRRGVFQPVTSFSKQANAPSLTHPSAPGLWVLPRLKAVPAVVLHGVVGLAVHLELAVNQTAVCVFGGEALLAPAQDAFRNLRTGTNLCLTSEFRTSTGSVLT